MKEGPVPEPTAIEGVLRALVEAMEAKRPPSRTSLNGRPTLDFETPRPTSCVYIASRVTRILIAWQSRSKSPIPVWAPPR
jgi:hypothetical protein